MFILEEVTLKRKTGEHRVMYLRRELRQVKPSIVHEDLRKQYCPFQEKEAPCGDWCPLFLWSLQTSNGEPTGRASVRLACSRMDTRTVDLR